MYRRRRLGARRHKHRRGGSLLSSIGNFLKKNKFISKAASHVIQHGPKAFHGIAKGVHAFARHHGYSRRRVGRPRVGLRRRRVHKLRKRHPGMLRGLIHHRLRKRHRMGARRGGGGQNIPPFPLALNTPLKYQQSGYRNVGLARVKGSGRRRVHRGRGRGCGGRKRHHRRRYGRGILDSIHNFIKSNKLISRAGHAISGLLPGPFANLGRAASDVASHYGYGKRKGGVAIIRPAFKAGVGRSYGVSGGRRHRGGNVPFSYNNSMFGMVRF